MTTAVPGTPRHEAVLHSSPVGLAGLLAPRIRAALTDRHVVVAVLDQDHEAALRTELADLVGSIEFRDPADVHRVPAFTVAVRFARTGRQAAQAGRQALVISQHLPDLPAAADEPRDPGHWARLDIALNIAIAGLPITVLCLYSSPALTQARLTHPVVTTGTGSAPSPEYRPPREAVIDHPPPPPPDLGPPTAETTFVATGLADLRHLVERVAARAGLGPDRGADLVLAVNELASNSVEHGPGSGRFRARAGPGRPVVAEITDHGGEMDAPFPGLVLPPPEGARGRGLWLASELCDVLQVWSDADVTVIRVSLGP